MNEAINVSQSGDNKLPFDSKRLEWACAQTDIRRRNELLHNLIQVILLYEYTQKEALERGVDLGDKSKEMDIQLEWTDKFSTKFRGLVSTNPQIYQNFANERTREETMNWIRANLYSAEVPNANSEQRKVA